MAEPYPEALATKLGTPVYMAADKGWYFIDFYALFKEAVEQGQLLYFRYDTHWNEGGRMLATQESADFIRNTPKCPLAFE